MDEGNLAIDMEIISRFILPAGFGKLNTSP
jgi:hypothetical protein